MAYDVALVGTASLLPPQRWKMEPLARVAVMVLVSLHAVVRAEVASWPSTIAVLVLVAIVAGAIVVREARPTRAGRFRFGGSAIRMGGMTTGGVTVLQAIGILWGGGALWMLVGLMAMGTGDHGGFEVVFTIALLLLFIIPGLVYRPRVEVDFRSDEVRRYWLSPAIPWLSSRYPRRFSIVHEQHVHLRTGERLPRHFTAVIAGDDTHRTLEVPLAATEPVDEAEAERIAAAWNAFLNQPRR